MPQQQLISAVAKIFNLSDAPALRAIGEVFNVFNNANPGNFRRASRFRPARSWASRIRRSPQPTTHLGDSGPEQRVGQIGVVSRSDVGRSGAVARLVRQVGWARAQPTFFVSRRVLSLPASPALPAPPAYRPCDLFEVFEVMNLRWPAIW